VSGKSQTQPYSFISNFYSYLCCVGLNLSHFVLPLPQHSYLCLENYIVGAALVAKTFDAPLSGNGTPLLKARELGKNQKYSLF
jgi:hypothetical protein